MEKKIIRSQSSKKTIPNNPKTISKAPSNKIIDDSTKLINNILNDKNIPEQYKKTLINVPIKLDEKPKKEIKNETNNPISNTKITLKLEELIKATINKVEKYKQEIENLESTKQPIDRETTLLKSELINLKTKHDLLKLKTDCYEKIYYSTKNLIDNCLANSDTNLEYVKNKLNDLFSQSNKEYYDQLSNIKIEENYNSNKSIDKLETSLSSLLNQMNKEISNKTFSNENFKKIKEYLTFSLKDLLSIYTLGNSYNIQFRHKSKFILDNESKIDQLEYKRRSLESFNNFKNYFEDQNCFNKISNKNKNDLFEKVKDTINFYENLNIVLKTENTSLKENTGSYVNQVNDKYKNIEKLIDNFLIFSEESFNKLKELINLLPSKNLKNYEKVIIGFLKAEDKNFLDLVDKYEHVYKQFKLIR